MRRSMEGSQRIKVYLDGTPLQVFRGMKLKHILSHELVEGIKRGIKIVVDEEGNERGLEGTLAEGEKFSLKRRKKT
jgi:hypothetical protein